MTVEPLASVTAVVAAVRQIVSQVVDPEIPVLTIADLGILRDVRVGPGGEVEVVITPTYSGCPAMAHFESEISAVLGQAGYAEVTVTTVLSPPWTTDDLSAAGRRKLAAYGIAPPVGRAASGPVNLSLAARRPAEVACPRCGAVGRESARFGSTACKAAYVCTGCGEPFDYVKAI